MTREEVRARFRTVVERARKQPIDMVPARPVMWNTDVVERIAREPEIEAAYEVSD